MSLIQETLKIAEEALGSLSRLEDSILPIMFKALIISKNLGDSEVERWIEKELNGYNNEDTIPDYRQVPATIRDRGTEIASLFGYSYRLTSDSPIAAVKLPCFYPFAEIEKLATEGAKGLVFIKDQEIIPISVTRGDFQRIKMGIATKLLDYLTKAVRNLKYESTLTSIFETKRDRVVEFMTEKFPEAIAKFNSAYERLTDGSSEAYSHALESCRRLLSDTADLVYPSRKELVQGRQVTQDKYINRIWAFLAESVTSDSNRTLLQSSVNYLGKFIENLNDLLSKGVHDLVTKEEADRAVLYTYMVIADILTVYKNLISS